MSLLLMLRLGFTIKPSNLWIYIETPPPLLSLLASSLLIWLGSSNKDFSVAPESSHHVSERHITLKVKSIKFKISLIMFLILCGLCGPFGKTKRVKQCSMEIPWYWRHSNNLHLSDNSSERSLGMSNKTQDIWNLSQKILMTLKRNSVFLEPSMLQASVTIIYLT